MNRILAWTLLALLTVAVSASAQSGDGALHDARLLRFPDIHEGTIAFSYAGDIWTVPAAGGRAQRLTTGDGLEIFPRFSADGKWIAFTGHYDGSSDVYVIPAAGGIPRRLTWYPARVNTERMGWDNMVIGWTPEGKILFRSQRGPIGGFVGEPYTVSPEGGPVERFPLPESGGLSFSPDGKKIAYNRIFRDFRTWKRYRGGMAQDVWIYDLQSKAIERITDWEGADLQPMWIDGAIYFVSDREDWKLNLWRYDVATRATTRATDFKEFDVKWPHAGSGKIVFENGGWLHVLEPASGKVSRVTVDLPDDRKLARRRWIKTEGSITGFALAPGGQRAVIEARGDLYTVPAEHGNTRNITATPGAREREAAWSPDGKWIACISDASGEEELDLVPQDGHGKPVRLTEGSATWHFSPVWSPDSRKLAWADRALKLWTIEIEEKKPVLVDQTELWEISQYAWSPDSKWIAYVKGVENNVPTVFLHSLETRSITQVTDGIERAGDPVFDPEGSYLYFLSDRDIHPVMGNFELSFTVNRMTRPYAVTLRADMPSPFAPRSDEAKVASDKKDFGPGAGPGEEKKAEEKREEKKGDEKKPEEKKAPDFRINLDRIAERVVGFPVGSGEYRTLRAVKGKVLWLTASQGGGPSLHLFDLKAQKDQEILRGAGAYELAPDGGRLIYRDGGMLGITDVKDGLKPGDGRLDLSGMEMELDPIAEWAQIFGECFRLERDFFYLQDMGRLDWPAIRRRYEPLLPFVSHRNDLTYVLGELIGELGTGHTYVGGGDEPHPARVPVGLLGADLEFDRQAGRWRIARILEGQNWLESRRSPLTEPGVNVAPGDYLLAIDGQDLPAAEEPYRFLVQKAGRAVSLLVSAKPEREGAREVTVKPVASETDLRYYNWVEGNRRKVDQASGGRVGYIHIPDMQARGLEEFIRQYYPQVRKQGMIVDVRYNGGGFISQIILERLRRVLIGMVAPRGARPDTVPEAALNGPLVALLNQYSASDGDLFPYYFKKYGLGPLIGKRSWGGVVGIRGMAGNLVDGGYLTMPEFAHYGLESDWIIENHGVDPDIEVDNLPGDEMEGKDAQLERGIQEVLKRIEEKKPAFPPRPPSKDLRPPSEKKRARDL
jgi:tricorn protease